MNKPTLVIMAAGMGSRYGGLKQIDRIDKQGHILMDFSVYDAKRAGFEEVVFVIKKENEAIFREVIGDKVAQHMKVSFAFQQVGDIPEGFRIPEGRVRPWGTAHAVFSCRDLVKGSFAVINADDYYGIEAFRLIYDFLTTHQDDEKYRYTMVGYELAKTVTDNGYVSRGVCEVNEKQELIRVTEITRIEKKEGAIAYTQDEGATWNPIPKETTVSMNMWGFTNSMLKEIEQRFPAFLRKGLAENPLKCEYYLPSVVSELLAEGKAAVTVLKSKEQWHGVTYQEDKPIVVKAMQELKNKGLYPERLWG